MRAQARLSLGTAGRARVEVCLEVWGSGGRGDGWEGASACVRGSTCLRRRGRAPAQLVAGVCVCWLFVCLAGWLGLALKVSAHPPPPSPSVPLYPLPGLSLCPCSSWGRGMLLPAGVTVNPVGRTPSSSLTLQSRSFPTLPTPHPATPCATVLGCALQQLKGTEVTPGDPQMHQKPGFGPVALGGIHSSPVRPPIRSGPQGRMKGGGPPCGRGAGSSLAGREMEGKAGLHPGGRAGGLRAPGAGGGNPSPLVCGAGVRLGGADPRLLLGGRGWPPPGAILGARGARRGKRSPPGS